jgi:hypothetical protein
MGGKACGSSDRKTTAPFNRFQPRRWKPPRSIPFPTANPASREDALNLRNPFRTGLIFAHKRSSFAQHRLEVRIQKSAFALLPHLNRDSLSDAPAEPASPDTSTMTPGSATRRAYGKPVHLLAKLATAEGGETSLESNPWFTSSEKPSRRIANTSGQGLPRHRNPPSIHPDLCGNLFLRQQRSLCNFFAVFLHHSRLSSKSHINCPPAPPSSPLWIRSTAPPATTRNRPR